MTKTSLIIEPTVKKSNVIDFKNIDFKSIYFTIGYPGCGKTFGQLNSVISTINALLDKKEKIIFLTYNRKIVIEILNYFIKKLTNFEEDEFSDVQKREYLSKKYNLYIYTMHAIGKNYVDENLGHASQIEDSDAFDILQDYAHLNNFFSNSNVVIDEFQDLYDFIHNFLTERNDFKSLYMFGDFNQRTRFAYEDDVNFIEKLYKKSNIKKLNTSYRCSDSWMQLFIKLGGSLDQRFYFKCKDKKSKLTIKELDNSNNVDSLPETSSIVCSTTKQKTLVEKMSSKKSYGYGQTRGLTISEDTVLHDIKNIGCYITEQLKDVVIENPNISDEYIQKEKEVLKQNLIYINATRYAGNITLYLNEGKDLKEMNVLKWFNGRYTYKTYINRKEKTVPLPFIFFKEYFKEIRHAFETQDKKEIENLDNKFMKFNDINLLHFLEFCKLDDYKLKTVFSFSDFKFWSNTLNNFQDRFEDIDKNIVNYLDILSIHRFWEFIINYITPIGDVGNKKNIAKLKIALEDLFKNFNTDFDAFYKPIFTLDGETLTLPKQFNSEVVSKKDFISSLINSDDYILKSNTVGKSVGKSIGSTQKVYFQFENNTSLFYELLSENGFAMSGEDEAKYTDWNELTSEKLTKLFDKVSTKYIDSEVNIMKLKANTYSDNVNFMLFDFDKKDTPFNCYDNLVKKSEEILKISNCSEYVIAKSKSGGTHLFLFFNDRQVIESTFDEKYICGLNQYNSYKQAREEIMIKLDKELETKCDRAFTGYIFKHKNNVVYRHVVTNHVDNDKISEKTILTSLGTLKNAINVCKKNYSNSVGFDSISKNFLEKLFEKHPGCFIKGEMFKNWNQGIIYILKMRNLPLDDDALSLLSEKVYSVGSKDSKNIAREFRKIGIYL